MSGTKHNLHEIQPREQVGAQTGHAYEYQYHQAAAEALTLLDDSQVVCIYCEWHDDYVTEAAQSGSYSFHQVKTRQKSRGPWKYSEFFGLPRKRKTLPLGAADADSLFARLWDHVRKFSDRCAGFIVVTDVGVDDAMSGLLSSVKSAPKRIDLTGSHAEQFEHLFNSLSQTFGDLTDDSLFHFLSHLSVRDGVGVVRNLHDCRVLIGDRIREASEVDLRLSEAEKIGADLVAVVRERSHRTLNELPKSAKELRIVKGLEINNLLRLLSLSTEGYRQLRVGGRASVISLSRLHRLCKRSNVPEELIPDLCRYKTGWDAWWIDQKHRVDLLDFSSLKAECADLLRAHSGGSMSFDVLIQQAGGTAEKYRARLTSSSPLTGELVLGFIIAIAVEAEI